MFLRRSALLLTSVLFVFGCRTSGVENASDFHSDHIDGPATSKHSITDMVDMYAFPTPRQEGKLTVILNVHPLSRSHNHFSDKVNYRFFLRPLTVGKNFDQVVFSSDEKKEAVITCSFKTPEDHGKHTMTCEGPGVGSETVVFNNAATATASGKLRLYHGLRSDPFFFYAKWATSAASDGVMIAPKNSNIMDKTNVLSVIVEFKPSDIFGKDVGLLGLAAQSYTMENGKFKPLDRLGRPEVTNVTMVARGSMRDLRDQYNLDTPFRVPANNQQLYEDHIVTNINNYDSMDKKYDWKEGTKQNYAAMIVDDFLVFDMTKSKSGANYFAIEQSLLNGQKYSSFGGRHPNNDIMDTLFGILINFNRGPIADGVASPSRPISQNFPYLAEPDDSWAGWAKAKAARWKLGIEDNE